MQEASPDTKQAKTLAAQKIEVKENESPEHPFPLENPNDNSEIEEMQNTHLSIDINDSV